MRSDTSSQRRPLIVVIDDNFDNRLIMKSYLRDLSLECQTLTAGWQLFNQQLDPAPALILLDLQMPLEDGFEIATQIRQDSRFERTKLVAVTANNEATFSQQALRAGFHGYILKPLDRERFKQHISRILSGGVVWEGSFGARPTIRSVR